MLYPMEALTYKVSYSTRARHVRITVQRDATVVLTVPRRADLAAAQKFLHSRAAWVAQKVAKFKAFGFEPHIRRTRAEVQQLKAQTLALIKSRIHQLNAPYNFTFKKITIRNQKTRWGSCSKSGNLSFNYRTALLPPRLADYIVVHELCHLGEMNHSPRFWSLVARTFPDYRELRRQLRASPVSSL